MKSKIFIFTTLILVVFLFVITSCDNFLNAKNKTTININLDLSKILKTSRNETTTIPTEYILKVFAYNAATYKPEDEIENLPLLTQTENKVDINGNVKASLDIEIGLNVIFVAKLYQGKSEKPLYAGKSEVIKIKATDNKVHLVLSKTIADVGLDVDINTAYTVEHYQENLEDDGYTLFYSDTGDASINSVNITAENYEGFYVKSFDEQINSLDNSTIIKIYYARYVYAVSFDTNGGTPTNIVTQYVKYGGKASVPETVPTLASYVFSGWTEGFDNGTVLSNSVFDFNSVIKRNINLYVMWKTSFVYVKGATIQDGIKGGGYTTSEIFKEGTNVSIQNFYMSDHEVTQGEYISIMGSWPDESVTVTEMPGVGDNYPAYYISWFDTLVYCNKRSIQENLTPCYSINGSTDPDAWGEVPRETTDEIYSSWFNATCDFQANGYRLPTEAEWEYAARGGNELTGYQYKFAGSDTLNDVAWCGANSDRTSHEVKSKNSNGLYLHDMSGNLWEWVWDKKENSSVLRCSRGGYWENGENDFYVSSRYYHNSEILQNNVGFRLVRSAEPEQGDVYSAGITIDGTTYAKTGEVVIIPAGTVAQIAMTDDSSWNTYYEGDDASLKGVFLNGRKVQLSPFAMSQFEVTQELYKAVIGSNPSHFQTDVADGEIQNLRPVECITWYDAVNFCNELTKRTMGEEHCVYKIENASYPNDYVEYADVSIDLSKKGYRLPTEAEWEFAARGGDPTKPEWKYAYAGVQTNIAKDSFSNYQDSTSLEEFGWYGCNSDSKTHEVGKKYPNTLGLFDMNGNVYEWCYDWHSDEIDTTFVNPLGANSGEKRSARGGCLTSLHKWASVGYRYTMTPGLNTDDGIGFRLVRTLK